MCRGGIAVDGNKENCIAETAVSFIIPAWQAADCLARCLDSLLEQSLANIEVWCAVGEEDAAAEIAERYAAKDARVRLLCGPAEQRGALWKQAVESASGTYVQWVLPQDTLLDYALEAAVLKMRRCALDAARFCAVACHEKGGEAVANAACDLSGLRHGDFQRLFDFSKDKAELLGTQRWQWLFRRESLLKIREALAEDEALFSRFLGEPSLRVMAVRDRLVLHRTEAAGTPYPYLHAACGQPKVSVVVPVYNQEEYLNQALSSLSGQVLEEMEFLCVNDGSTDSSMTILREYAALDRRFIIIEKENSGYGQTMNRGIDAAKGEYLGILEPDDFVPPDMYERLYRIASAHDLDIVKADFHLFETMPDGAMSARRIRLTDKKRFYGRVVDTSEELQTFKFIMNTWSGIYRLSFLNENHIRHHETPGASYQDVGFWFQTFCCAKRVWFEDTPFYMYRQDNPLASQHKQGKLYASTREYDFISQWLGRDAARAARYEKAFYYKKFDSCLYTYRRIAPERHLEYLRHIGDEYREPMRQGKLDRAFFGAEYWKALNLILKDPEAYEKRHGVSENQRINAKRFRGPLAVPRRKAYTAWIMLRCKGWKAVYRLMREKIDERTHKGQTYDQRYHSDV